MKFWLCIAGMLLVMPCLGQSMDSVVVLPVKMAVPGDAIKLGSIKEGDNVTKLTCDYEKTVLEAKQKAALMGGNLVKITELVSPSFISKCYKIKADVYRTKKLPVLSEGKPKAPSSIPDSLNKFATLYFFRMKDTIIPTPYYKIHLNDSVICTARSKWSDSVNVPAGQVTLWAKTDNKAELKIDLKNGGHYYIMCGLYFADYWLTPKLDLLDNSTGAALYAKFRKGNKEVGVEYLGEVH